MITSFAASLFLLGRRCTRRPRLRRNTLRCGGDSGMCGGGYLEIYGHASCKRDCFDAVQERTRREVQSKRYVTYFLHISHNVRSSKSEQYESPIHLLGINT